MRCPYCHLSVPRDSQFCPHCGMPFADEKPPEAVLDNHFSNPREGEAAGWRTVFQAPTLPVVNRDMAERLCFWLAVAIAVIGVVFSLVNRGPLIPWMLTAIFVMLVACYLRLSAPPQ